MEKFNPEAIIPEQRKRELGFDSTRQVRRAAISMRHEGYGEKCPITGGNPLAY